MKIGELRKLPFRREVHLLTILGLGLWLGGLGDELRVRVGVKVRVRARVRVSKFGGELLHQCRPVLLITQASVRPDTCVKLASRDADVTSLVELYVVRAGKTTRQFEFYQKTHNNLRCAKRTICTFVGNNSDICRSTSGCCVNCVIP